MQFPKAESTYIAEAGRGFYILKLYLDCVFQPVYMTYTLILLDILLQ